VPKVVYRSGCRVKHNRLRRDSNLGPLAQQSDELTTRPLRSFMPLTVILIIISFPSPTLSFIPGLKPPFSANPSHCSVSFSS